MLKSLTLVLVASLFCACATKGPGNRSGGEQLYAQAKAGYLAGDYARAAELFRRAAGEPGGRNAGPRALFGLACAGLAKAQTEQDLAAARADWSGYLARDPKGLAWDPELMTPLLLHLTGACAPGPQTLAGQEPKALAGQLPDADRSAELLRNRVSAMEQIGLLKKALDDKAEEIERLRRQILALERLHLELSHRKQGFQ